MLAGFIDLLGSGGDQSGSATALIGQREDSQEQQSIDDDGSDGNQDRLGGFAGASRRAGVSASTSPAASPCISSPGLVLGTRCKICAAMGGDDPRLRPKQLP